MTTWPWPAPEPDGQAAHLIRGYALPAVALPATSGGTLSLDAICGKAVMFFYPWAGRPGVANPPAWDDIPGAHGSTPEAEGFQRHIADFDARGYRVFGVSGQSAIEQREIAARLGLSYPLLSDADGVLRLAMGLPSFETGGVIYLKRLTLFVAEGRIRDVVYPVHPPDTHAEDLLGLIDR